MYKLIITEKPSVAQSIAAVLGAQTRKTGYIEGNGYLVSWCIGHLATLASADVYDKRYAKWIVADLPIVPEHWRYVVPQEKQPQFLILRDLMHRADVEAVINACDAGREGELIFRNVYSLAGCTKPMLRLWISSMEDAAIRSGFQNLRPSSDYDGLYQAALCRAKADWLVGINATRLYSVLHRCTMNVGRVQSPTLAMVVQREQDIDTFVPTKFFTVRLVFNGCEAVSPRMEDREAAAKLAAGCKNQTAVIASVERREKSEKAPALYDLTTLQREANRTLGYTAQQTLDYLQSLYEKKLCTYPRTDSRFLTEDMADTVPVLVSVAADICQAGAPATVYAAQLCNSKKVSDHHAIVPTQAAGSVNLEELPTGEREILKLVSAAVLRAVCNSYRYEETVVTVQCCDAAFFLQGKAVLDMGWKQYTSLEESTSLPAFSQGQRFPVESASVKSGKTTPPKRFTEDTLLAAMEAAGTADNAERRGLGTPATRAAILEKLVSKGFVQRKKLKKVGHLMPQPLGVSLTEALPEPLKSPELTVRWEQQLQQIEQGQLPPEVFLSEIEQMLRDLVQSAQQVSKTA
jgi:DNA topoisomerase-3